MGTVRINSSKKTKSRPAWKIPTMAAKTVICQVECVSAIANG